MSADGSRRFAQRLDFLTRGFDQVRTRNHETRTELDQCGNMVDIGTNSADTENLAVRLAGFRRCFISRPVVSGFSVRRECPWPCRDR